MYLDLPDEVVAQIQSDAVQAYKDELRKTHKWREVIGTVTPGGTPLYRCPICDADESGHFYGVEYPNPKDECPHCHMPLTYF